MSSIKTLKHGDKVLAAWRNVYRIHTIGTLKGYVAEQNETYGVRDESYEETEARAIANGHELIWISPEAAIMDGTVKPLPEIELQKGELVMIEGKGFTVGNHPSAREHLVLKPV